MLSDATHNKYRKENNVRHFQKSQFKVRYKVRVALTLTKILLSIVNIIGNKYIHNRN